MIGAGFAVIEHHAVSAGESAAPAPRWPGDSALALDKQRPTLVVFAHPRCPCTRASYEELNRTLARFPEAMAVKMVFTVPEEADESWLSTYLVRTAAQNKGIGVFMDRGGREAQRFNAHTSGTCLLFDAKGGLLFNGGVTSARAHEGDNAGRDALEACLRNETSDTVTFAVFGCGLVRAPDSHGASL